MEYGLSSVLIAFNTHGAASRGTLDMPLRANIIEAIAELRQMEGEEHERRRSPLYWADRAFHLLVSPVGYIIRAIFGVDVDRSAVWAPLARIASLVCEFVAAFAAGRAVGWW